MVIDQYFALFSYLTQRHNPSVFDLPLNAFLRVLIEIGLVEGLAIEILNFGLCRLEGNPKCLSPLLSQESNINLSSEHPNSGNF